MASDNKIRRLLREDLEKERSRNNWQTFWRKQGFRESGITEPEIKWFYNKEIRIHRMPSIGQQVVHYVQEGIYGLISQIGLDISVVDCEIHDSVINQVEMARERKGFINHRKLADILSNEIYRDPERGGKPHADVVLVDNRFFRDENSWGNANFRTGHIIISLQENRQQLLDYIKRISRHEAGHLLGLCWHHDSEEAKTGGYDSVNLCNMLYSVPTLTTCDKCLDAIRYFWVGVEEKTGRKYFK